MMTPTSLAFARASGSGREASCQQAHSAVPVSRSVSATVLKPRVLRIGGAAREERVAGGTVKEGLGEVRAAAASTWLRGLRCPVGVKLRFDGPAMLGDGSLV